METGDFDISPARAYGEQRRDRRRIQHFHRIVDRNYMQRSCHVLRIHPQIKAVPRDYKQDEVFRAQPYHGGIGKSHGLVRSSLGTRLRQIQRDETDTGKSAYGECSNNSRISHQHRMRSMRNQGTRFARHVHRQRGKHTGR